MIEYQEIESRMFESRKVQTVGVLNHVNSLNLGDASLIYMIVKIVQQSLNPNKIFVFSFNVANDAQIINAINDENVRFISSPARAANGDRSKGFLEMLSYLCWGLVLRITGKDISNVLTMLDKSVCGALRNSDLIIIEGGDSLTDIYGSFSLIKHLYNIFLTLLLKKRMLIFGNSLGPFYSSISKKMMFFLLRKMENITVRDRRSVSLLHEARVDEGKIHFIPDVAFDLPAEKTITDPFIQDHKKINVGIIPSALLSKIKGGESFAQFMASICDMIENKYDAKIVFIPHVIYEGNDDRDVALEIIRKMRNKDAILIQKETNPLRVKYIISRLDLLISPRMHPIIHALSSGVPVIAIDYNNKTREVMQLFDKNDWVLDLEELDKLEEVVNAYFAQKQSDRSFYQIKKLKVLEEYVQFLRNAVSLQVIDS